MLNKNLKTTKHNIMTAILINTINDYRVVVHSTTEHPSSSYGMPVWVDKDNEAYMQVGATTPFYKVIPVDALDQPQDDHWRHYRRKCQQWQRQGYRSM